MALKKLDELQANKSSTSKQGKRKRVNPFGNIVTSDQLFQDTMDEIEKKEEEEKAKKARKEAKTSGKGKEKKAVKEGEINKNSEALHHVPEFTDSDESDDDVDNDHEFSEENLHNSKSLFPPQSRSDAFSYLLEVWDNLNPPVMESEIIGKYFGVIYYDAKKKPHIFVGKVVKRFLFDEDGPTDNLSIEVFKKASTSTSTVLEEIPYHLGTDIAKYAIYDIICGPLKATFVRGSKWNVPEYPLAYETFDTVKGLDRKGEYEKMYPRVDTIVE